MQRLFTEHTYVGWVIVGVCLGLAHIHPLTWFLYIPAVWIFLTLLVKSSTRHVFLGACIAGTLNACFALSWFWSTYPLSVAGVPEGMMQLLLIGLYWLFFSMTIGLGFALVWYCYTLLLHNTSYVLVFTPAVWVLADMVGSFIFSLFTLGPGGTVNAYFSFGYIGYVLADIPLLFPLARVGGVYALSFFAILVVLVVFLIHKKATRTKPQSLFLVGVLLAGAVGSYMFHIQTAPTESDTHVLAIDTYFSGEQLLHLKGFVEKEASVVDAVVTALQEDADVIVLPEDSRFTLAFLSSYDALAFITKTKREGDVTVIDSGRITDERGLTVLRAFIYDTATQSVSVVDKQYLVPQGEFIPYIISAIARTVVGDTFVKELEATHSYRRGQAVGYKDIPETVPPVLFCMESVSPVGVQNVRKERSANTVVHPISHAWFHDSFTHPFQLSRMLRVQALWNNVTIVEAGNMKESKQYTSDGMIQEGVLVQEGDKWEIRSY